MKEFQEILTKYKKIFTDESKVVKTGKLKEAI